MAETNIEWADFTFNHIRGCTKVSPACDHCYAETMSKRNPGVLGVWGKYGTRSIASESYWKLPEKWNRQAEREGVRKKVFCASLADVFEGGDTMPESAKWEVYQARMRLAGVINSTPHLDWLLLTKRPENVIQQTAAIRAVTDINLLSLTNVWIGTTVENQKYADLRIPALLKIPAKVRFLSVEPMLGPIVLPRGHVHRGFPAHITKEGHAVGPDLSIHWVICGGESGAGARPMHPDWVQSLCDQCVEAGVPFFFKQWGNWTTDGSPFHHKSTTIFKDGSAYDPTVHKQHVVTGCDVVDLFNVGKKYSGRDLDGRRWSQFPEVTR